MQTFAITFRPLDGVNEEQVQKFAGWCSKACRYYHVITEKTGHQRHVHAGIVTETPCTRSNVVQRMMQLFPDLSAEEKRVFRQGIKIMYNADFIGNYLAKGDDTVVIRTCLPEKGHLEKFFPPKAQDYKASVSGVKKCSAYYWELERYWYEIQGPHVEVTTINCRDFLFKLMYDLRLIPVLKDSATIKNQAQNLARFICKVDNASCIELAPFEKEEGYGIPSGSR